MADFTPADGAIFFAWRNTFHRVAERTYDWVYRRSDIVDGTGYVIQDIPFQEEGKDIDWVRLIHERVFDDEAKVQRYCAALQRRYSQSHGPTAGPLVVKVAGAAEVASEELRYSNGVLTLPAHGDLDIHEDPSGDPIHRERFIASRWRNRQRHWPIAEHHLLHALAHHVSGDATHSDVFEQAFFALLKIASDGKNFSAEIWQWEMKIAQRLLTSGAGAVDMTSGDAYDATGARMDVGALAGA